MPHSYWALPYRGQLALQTAQTRKQFEKYTITSWWCSGFWRRVDSTVDASPEDGDRMFLRNVGVYRRVYSAPKPRTTSSSPSENLKSHTIVY
jgi:hypothetical protein